MAGDWGLVALREQVTQLLADALSAEERHDAELRHRDELHLAETARRDQLHLAETARRDESHLSELQRREALHDHEMELIRDALATRDIIGQAKGVVMVAMGCTADEAFQLIRSQSMHENRTVAAIAAEIAGRAGRGGHPLGPKPSP